MEKKQTKKRGMAWLLAASLCLTSSYVPKTTVQAADFGDVTLHNPDINGEGESVWHCIYFGNYWQGSYTPQTQNQPVRGENDVEHEDTDGTRYLVRKDGTCYKYEPIKWRVLSVNEDGTDTFLIADQVIDVAQYYRENGIEVTWETSDIRQWLNSDFMETAFTADEQSAIEVTEVTTADNQWSGEPGGNDTEDKLYLPSIEEMLDAYYGFSIDAAEGDTRKIKVTDYVEKGGTPNQPPAGFLSYWLRSPGASKGHPAQVGHWGEGEILTEPSVMIEAEASYLGVRPVMHVDLSNTQLWSYAGQVTPKGVFVPEVIKPGKPAIKKLTSKKAKQATVTLSKEVPDVSGYQLAYSEKSSMKGQKSKLFQGTSVTVKGLKANKTYYFRVRAYIEKNGEKTYGSWGSKKHIKVKGTASAAAKKNQDKGSF